MTYTEHLRSVYDKMVAKERNIGLEKGLEQGLEQGLRDALLGVYEARFGAPPVALTDAVESQQDFAVLQGWVGPFATLGSEEVLAVVLDRDPEA